MTDEERSQRSKIAAHESWANTADRAARTAKARAAFEAKFLEQADGDPVRAAHLKKAHYARLALKSAVTRRKARAAKDAAEEARRNEASYAASVWPMPGPHVEAPAEIVHSGIALTEFLLARLDEDERAYRDFRDVHGGVGVSPRLVDVASKRSVVYHCSADAQCTVHDQGRRDDECSECVAAWHVGINDDRVLRYLARPYADHPDYREEWRL